jgi:dTDP-4-amino-4,6-dideoxygalactose transaminase
MNVRFLNLSIQDEAEKRRLAEIFLAMLDRGIYVMGPEIFSFEQKIAAHCGRKYAIAVGSGTDALFTMLRAARIGVGHEVICPCWSWIATANAIKMTGATPVFVDVKEDMNINPERIEEKITSSTRAVLFVNFNGRMADHDKIESICKNYSLKLFEDGSQSFGASYLGKKSGAVGMASAISHNPMKIFGALGEAGTILTDDTELYETAQILRYNGTINRETCVFPSLNSRMDTMQAAFLIEKFSGFEHEIIRRRELAETYSDKLSALVDTPLIDESRRDIFYTYTIKCSRRDELQKFLEEGGIETKVQHRDLMPLHPAYKCSGYSEFDFPVGFPLSKRVLSLPLHSRLTNEEVDYVIARVTAFYS